MKLYKDSENGFEELFSPETGLYIRGDAHDADGNNKGDPFMRNFPALIDIGVMGHCIHGSSGLCAKAGIQCYQNGLTAKKPNMSLENFKKIVDECKDKTFQFALGGCGDVDQHENFEELLKYCKDNDIVPNFTTSGFGLTPEIAQICKKYCGAVAVSMYSRLDNLVPDLAIRKLKNNEPSKTYISEKDIPTLFTLGNFNKNCFFDAPQYIINGVEYEWEYLHHFVFNETPQRYEVFKVYTEKYSNSANYTMKAINLLLENGVKTNIHYVLSNATIDEAIIRLKHNGFPKGINAVIFLLHKPVGLGKEDNVLQLNDKRVQDFFKLIDNNKFDFQIGFDSCTVPGLINTTKNISPESIDSCEAARFSMYITPDMKAIPCSFDNQDLRWAFDIQNKTIQEAWNSEIFNDFRKHFLNSCCSCHQKSNCLGGCPIKRQIVLCDKKEKDLYEKSEVKI